MSTDVAKLNDDLKDYKREEDVYTNNVDVIERERNISLFHCRSFNGLP
jgi:hypothetical protein